MTSAVPSHLRLATRGSALALAQARSVADALERAHPELAVGIVTITTSGDLIQDRPLYEEGGKGLFTKEVELALLRNQADFAVHSFKDVPVTMPLVPEAEHELIIAAVPVRGDARDVLISGPGGGLADLPAGARVGTSSSRRRALVLAARPDVQVVPLRGNVDTRLAKLAAGEVDAVVLAMAGLRRLGLFDGARMIALDPNLFVPAAGQGALAVQCRRTDEGTRQALAVLDDPASRRCVEIERRLVAALEGGCTSPIGAHAAEDGDGFRLVACDEWAGALQRASATGSAEGVVQTVAAALRAQ